MTPASGAHQDDDTAVREIGHGAAAAVLVGQAVVEGPAFLGSALQEVPFDHVGRVADPDPCMLRLQASRRWLLATANGRELWAGGVNSAKESSGEGIWKLR